MRFLLFTVLGLFVQEASAEVRQFVSPYLKGLQRLELEVRDDGTERLVGFWRYQHTHWVGGGLVVLKIANNQLLKIWEDNSTLAYVNGYGSSDLNKDGKLDFVIAGSGYTEQMNYHKFTAFYLSEGEDQYIRQIIPTDVAIHHLSLGNVDSDEETEIVFTEQFDSHPESNVCGWLELEVKIGHWVDGSFQARGTGINLPVGDDWLQFLLGDVDNDGEDEAVIHNYGYNGRTILVYNLNGETTPAWTISRPNTEVTISVNRAGQIVELKEGESRPTILSLNGGASKITTLEIPEIDLGQWRPIQMTLSATSTNLILSEGVNGNNTARQLTIY